MVTWPQARPPDQTCWRGHVKQDVGEANTASSTTNGREPPPTHLADVLGGFLIDSREGPGRKQLECSTKKLMLAKTKLGEDIPGGSSSESVPTSDELDHGPLIADPTRFYGPVAVVGAPPSRAAIVLLLHRRLPFPERNRRHHARGCPVERPGRRCCSPCRGRCSIGRVPVAIPANRIQRLVEHDRDSGNGAPYPTRASGSPATSTMASSPVVECPVDRTKNLSAA